MEIKDMKMTDVETRMAEISAELDGENITEERMAALENEVAALKERRTFLNGLEERKKTMKEMTGESGKVVRTFKKDEAEERKYDSESAEYRNAFFKNLMGEELTKEERAAFVHTTSNTPAVLPKTTLDNIWNLVKEQHSIMGDIKKYVTGTVIEVLKHTGITQGDAATVGENEANSDEQNEFVKVTLSGKDFSKSVDVSYAMEKMGIDTLEQYLVQEISDRLGAAMATDVVAQIEKDMKPENKIEVTEKLTFAHIAKLFGKLKRVSNVVVYLTRATLYNHLVGMLDANNRPIFQASAQAGVEGIILGAAIKIEDAVADNKILVGDAKKVVYNMVQDIMIEADKDIKKHVKTYSGYARGEGALGDPGAFAEMTITAGE